MITKGNLLLLPPGLCLEMSSADVSLDQDLVTILAANCWTAYCGGVQIEDPTVGHNSLK